MIHLDSRRIFGMLDHPEEFTRPDGENYYILFRDNNNNTRSRKHLYNNVPADINVLYLYSFEIQLANISTFRIICNFNAINNLNIYKNIFIVQNLRYNLQTFCINK